MNRLTISECAAPYHKAVKLESLAGILQCPIIPHAFAPGARAMNGSVVAMTILERPTGLIEPVPVFDELCSGLGAIEDFEGCCARFILYSEQTLCETGEPYRVVRRKILLPYEAVREGLSMTVDFMARRALERIRGSNVVRLRI